MLIFLKKNQIFAKKQTAYSLIELIITIVLMAIVMTIFFTVFGNNQKHSVTPVLHIKAAELGQAYLEEISLKRFDENSPIGNDLRCNDPATATVCSLLVDEASRVDFDDIDDYNGLLDSPPRDIFGNIRTGFNNFSVSIDVSFAGTDLGFPLQDLKRIQVTVVTPQNDQFIFSQYRANF